MDRAGQQGAGADPQAVIDAEGQDLRRPRQLPRRAQPAHLDGPLGVERPCQVGVELLVVAEVHVLEPALMGRDALAAEGAKAAAPEEHAAAAQQQLAHLGAQPREGRPLPVIGKAPGQGVAERPIVGMHQHAAGVEVAVAADGRGVVAEEALAVPLSEAGGGGQRLVEPACHLVAGLAQDAVPFLVGKGELQQVRAAVPGEDLLEVGADQLAVAGSQQPVVLDALARDLEDRRDRQPVGAQAGTQAIHVGDAVRVLPIDQELDDDQRQWRVWRVQWERRLRRAGCRPRQRRVGCRLRLR